MKPLEPACAASRAEWNAALAKLCGWTQWPSGAAKGWDWRPPEGAWDRHCAHCLPDFLAGLRPDGSCDEALVDWALVGKLYCRLRHVTELAWSRPCGPWFCRDLTPERITEQRAFRHPHPAVALARCAVAAGLPREKERPDA